MSRERVHRILGLCVSQNQLVTKFSSVKHNTSFSSPPPPDFYSIKHHGYFLSLVAFQKKERKKKKQHTQCRLFWITKPCADKYRPTRAGRRLFSVNTDSSGRSHAPCCPTWSTRWRQQMAATGTCWLSQLRVRRPRPLRGSLPTCDLAAALSCWFLSSKPPPPGFCSFTLSPAGAFNLNK